MSESDTDERIIRFPADLQGQFGLESCQQVAFAVTDDEVRLLPIGDDPFMAIGEWSKSIAQMLADATGKPVEEFEYDPEKYPIPHPKDLESVDPDEVYD